MSTRRPTVMSQAAGHLQTRITAREHVQYTDPLPNCTVFYKAYYCTVPSGRRRATFYGIGAAQAPAEAWRSVLFSRFRSDLALLQFVPMGWAEQIGAKLLADIYGLLAVKCSLYVLQ